MKCPYRKLFLPQITGETEEHYMECYKEECPFYVSEAHYSGGIVVLEHCKRGDKE